MRDLLFIWGRRVGVFLLLWVIASGIRNGYHWISGNWDSVLKFAKSNEAWGAGWAQAVGAVAGILIAVAVPAYQRYLQSLDSRRVSADLQQTLSQACYFLLGDAANYIRNLVGRPLAPRSQLGDPLTINTLLKRIEIWEARETDWIRSIMLYHARNFLLLSESTISGGVANAPLFQPEIDQLNSYLDLMTKLQDQADIDHRHWIRVSMKMKQILLVRWIHHIPPRKTDLPDKV